ncbi:MAG: acetyl-CoA hydrolase, partial [Thalassolituus sp.]|nr:acetyl-CoA hydrolase [Thalassolituus sp.]
MTQQFSSYGEMVEQVIKTCGPDIRLATILGLGKPNRLINALYDAVKGRDDLSLTIYTALSLNPPEASSDLESRFLTPFIERLYGKNFPRLKYADDMKAGRLPDNIHVEEFYTQPGSYVKSPQGQQNYNSLNYTEVADALSTKGINVVFQRVASKESGRYSLSSNTDLTQDVLERIHQAGQPRPYCVAEVDRNLPWVG